MSRAERYERAMKALREAVQKLPEACQPAVMSLWDADLSRTATRKVKRSEVKAVLAKLASAALSTARASPSARRWPRSRRWSAPARSRQWALPWKREGKTVLIFPEGTRSTSGAIQEFKAVIGHLALAHDVDILPVYLGGTHRALPKVAASRCTATSSLASARRSKSASCAASPRG